MRVLVPAFSLGILPIISTASALLADAILVTDNRRVLAPVSASGAVDSSAAGAGESFDSAFTSGSSLFDVDFDVPAPHHFCLTGLIAVNRLEEFPCCSADTSRARLETIDDALNAAREEPRTVKAPCLNAQASASKSGCRHVPCTSVEKIWTEPEAFPGRSESRSLSGDARK